MKRLVFRLLSLSLGILLALAAQAQTQNGLRGDYYAGRNFERHIQTRYDAQLDFSWDGVAPVGGMSPTDFSVRWTGWLIPPTTGRYVLHLTVDDGARLWLDGKPLLDEWRGQPLSYFEVPVELQAGRPYRLQLDYCQYSLKARIRFGWQRPWQPALLSSWRTLWGLAAEPLLGSRSQETVPAPYLFSQLAAAPGPAVVPEVALATALGWQPAPLSSFAGSPPRPRLVRVNPRLAPAPRPSQTGAASQRTATLAALLAKGQPLVLRALYFEQGKADLLPPVRASLDTLARALFRQPAVRLEVQGHTDNQGDSALNRHLSQQRAEAVCRYLAEQGVAPNRLRPVGLGGTQPIADNRLPAERPRNRRVVLRPLR
jgi:outer membrane protein OmpA-like peptidoglycan-associated protein